MKEVNALLCSNKDFKFITVQFETNSSSTGLSEPCTFKTLLDVKVEDKVVAPIVKGDVTRLKIGTVKEILSPYEVDFEGRTYTWIASILDFSVYEECIEAEKKMVFQLNVAKAKQLQDESMQILEQSVGGKVMDSLKSIVKKL